MRLTDKQRKQIIAEYLSGESKASLAKKFQVSHTAISKILSDEKVSKSFEKFNEETDLSMLAFIDSKRNMAQELISTALGSVKEKIGKASLRDTITVIEKLSGIFKDNELIENGDKVNINISIEDCREGEEDE